MKINLDDPNLTAYALGELSADDHAKVAEAIAGSPEAQSYVAETQQFARLLRAEYEADRQAPLADAAARRPYLVRMEEERRESSRFQWGSLAAALAIFAVLGALAVSTVLRENGSLAKRTGDNPKPAGPKEAASATVDAEPGPSLEMEVAQQPVNPQATTAPSTLNEFAEEKQDAGRNAAAGKYGGLAQNAPAPPPLRAIARPKPAPGEATESELPSRYRDDLNAANPS